MTSDIAQELARLHNLKGADFIRQLKMLTQLNVFKPVDNEMNIFAAEGSHREDMPALLNAARKAAALGNKVYILPNPKDIRTADYIFERKGVYKMFDLKSIYGKKSVSSRLMESIGQANHVLLNIMTEYEPRQLAKDIQAYFEANKDAREVLIMKGKKSLSVSRRFVEGCNYIKMFMKRYLR